MNAYGGVEVWLHLFLPQHSVQEIGQLHAWTTLPPEECASIIHWIGGLMGPRLDLDSSKKKKSSCASNQTTLPQSSSS